MMRKKKTVLFLWIPVGIVLAALLILLAGYVLALCEKPDLKNSKLTAKQKIFFIFISLTRVYKLIVILFFKK